MILILKHELPGADLKYFFCVFIFFVCGGGGGGCLFNREVNLAQWF